MFREELNIGGERCSEDRKNRKTYLTNGEEEVSIERKNKEAEEEAIKKYDYLIKRVVAKILKQNNLIQFFSSDELELAGAEGVMKAVRKKDLKKINGGEFAVYVECKIGGAVMDYIRKVGPISRGESKSIKEYKRVRDDLITILERKPSDNEIAKKLNISQEKYLELQRIFYKLSPQSLYFSKNNGNGGSSSVIGETYLNPNVVNKHMFNVNNGEIFDKKKLKKIIEKEMDCLPSKQQGYVRMHFLDEMAKVEVAKKMGVSESAVNQSISSAIEKMSKRINEDEESFLKQYYDDYLKEK